MTTNSSEYSREWREKNRSAARAHSRKYNKSEKGAAKNREGSLKYMKKNTEKVRAQQLVRNAVRRGDITPEVRCEECGEETKLHGHHDNYSCPLDVRWLCPPCHKEHHAAITEACCEAINE